jgi:hypothetical protein
MADYEMREIDEKIYNGDIGKRIYVDVYENGTFYKEISDYITSYDEKHYFDVGSNLQIIGLTPSKEYNLSVNNDDGILGRNLLNFDFNVYFKFQSEDENGEMIDTEDDKFDSGMFNVYSNPEKFTGEISMTGNDKIAKLDVVYDSKLSYSSGEVTVLDQLKEMSELVGIEFDTSNIDDIVKNQVIEFYDNTISIRNYVGWIAEANASNVIFDNEMLTFKKIVNTPQYNVPLDYATDLSLGETYEISGVVYTGISESSDSTSTSTSDSDSDSETTVESNFYLYSAGDDSKNVLNLDTDNPYITQEIVDSIYNQVVGLKFTSFEDLHMVKGNPLLSIGDYVNFMDEDGNVSFSAIIMSNATTFSSVFSSDYEGNISNEIVETTINKLSSPSTQLKNIKLSVDRNNARFTAMSQKIDDTNTKVGELSVDYEQFKVTVSDNYVSNDDVDEKVEDSLQNITIGATNLLDGTLTQNEEKGNKLVDVTKTNETFKDCTIFKSSVANANIGFDFVQQIIETQKASVGDKLTYSVYAKTNDTVEKHMYGLYVTKLNDERENTDESTDEDLDNDLEEETENEDEDTDIDSEDEDSDDTENEEDEKEETDEEETESNDINNLYDYYIVGEEIGVIGKEWKQFSYTFEVTEEMLNQNGNPASACWLSCYEDSSKGFYIYWACPQLEIGSIATDYAPSPSDIEEKTTAIQSRLTSAEEKLTAEQWSVWFTETINNSEAVSTLLSMDKEGLHIKNGGIEILNNDGTRVLYADDNGDLYLNEITMNTGVIGSGSNKFKLSENGINGYTYSEETDETFTVVANSGTGAITDANMFFSNTFTKTYNSETNTYTYEFTGSLIKNVLNSDSTYDYGVSSFGKFDELTLNFGKYDKSIWSTLETVDLMQSDSFSYEYLNCEKTDSYLANDDYKGIQMNFNFTLTSSTEYDESLTLYELLKGILGVTNSNVQDYVIASNGSFKYYIYYYDSDELASKVHIGTDGISMGDNFKVDNDGNITSLGGTIGGWRISKNYIISYDNTDSNYEKSIMLDSENMCLTFETFKRDEDTTQLYLSTKYDYSLDGLTFYNYDEGDVYKYVWIDYQSVNLNSRNNGIYIYPTEIRFAHDYTGYESKIYTDWDGDNQNGKFVIVPDDSKSPLYIESYSDKVEFSTLSANVGLSFSPENNKTYLNKSSLFFTKNYGIYMQNSDGNNCDVLNISVSNNVVFGYGSPNNVNIYANPSGCVQILRTGNTTNGILNLGSGYNSSYVCAVRAFYKDNTVHDIVERGTDGLISYFGWAGSSSYATITQIRGRTCKYQNSSGTTTLSDKNLKTDICDYDDRYDTFFDNIQPRLYKYILGSSKRPHAGYITQEIEDALAKANMTTSEFAGVNIMPIESREQEENENGEMVDIEDSSTNYLLDKGINEEHNLIYTEFISLNTWQIQKTKSRVQELENEVKELKEQLNTYLLSKESN